MSTIHINMMLMAKQVISSVVLCYQ